MIFPRRGIEVPIKRKPGHFIVCTPSGKMMLVDLLCTPFLLIHKIQYDFSCCLTLSIHLIYFEIHSQYTVYTFCIIFHFVPPAPFILTVDTVSLIFYYLEQHNMMLLLCYWAPMITLTALNFRHQAMTMTLLLHQPSLLAVDSLCDIIQVKAGILL